jgi:hypothetical protein
MSVRAGSPGALMHETDQNRSDACKQPPPPGLLAGLAEFNRGEFFQSHETLEHLWMEESRTVRSLYKGILQIGVAFHHLQAGRYHAVVFLLERGSGYLKPFTPFCMGIDVSHLLNGAARCLAQVRRLGPSGLNQFDWSLVPRIVISN